MKNFADDMAGAILDILKLVCYFVAGGLIVTVLLYAITWGIEWILVPIMT
ncbi:hypothetical protein QOZ98_002286 [Planomicrobium stackebrandtii]|uniref:TMhelix containing protein n=1 Tax=Planomicrobium stackebrandtii TaxID=253160 RepID=A0ABU0GWM6_9BACL|nr:hypothetical protein [Planomicrobium stackebrandtii]MDQ0429458.1 hypothetical protein [Planomicrobium stackebrandtii]